MGEDIFPKEGQGLVEYALILLFVVAAVLFALLTLGISIGDVLYGPIVEQFDSGPLLGVLAERTGYGSGNDVVVTIRVSGSTGVTVTDSQSEQSTSLACSGTCQATLTEVGFDAGTVTVTAGADSATARYPPKKPGE